MYERMPPTYARHPAKYERVPPGYSRQPGKYERTPPTLEKGPPMVKRGAPGEAQPAPLCAEAFDFPIEVAAVDEGDELHAVRVDAEEQAVVNADTLAINAGDGFEGDDARKCSGLSAGEATRHGEGGAGNLLREVVERFAEFGRKFDDAQGLVSRGLFGEVVGRFIVFTGICGVWFCDGRSAGFLERVAGAFEVAAERGALFGAFVEVGFESGEFLAQVAEFGFVGGLLVGAGGALLFVAADFAPLAFDVFFELADFGGLGVELLAGGAKFGGVFAVIAGFFGDAFFQNVAEWVVGREVELVVGTQDFVENRTALF